MVRAFCSFKNQLLDSLWIHLKCYTTNHLEWVLRGDTKYITLPSCMPLCFTKWKRWLSRTVQFQKRPGKHYLYSNAGGGGGGQGLLAYTGKIENTRPSTTPSILTKSLLPASPTPNSSLDISIFLSSVHCDKNYFLMQTLLWLLWALFQLDLNIWTSLFASALFNNSKNPAKMV